MKTEIVFLLCGLTFAFSALGQEIETLGKNVFGLEMKHPVMETVGTNLLHVFYRYDDGTFREKCRRWLDQVFSS